MTCYNEQRIGEITRLLHIVQTKEEKKQLHEELTNLLQKQKYLQ